MSLMIESTTIQSGLYGGNPVDRTAHRDHVFSEKEKVSKPLKPKLIFWSSVINGPKQQVEII